MPYPTLALVGVGLIGGSVGLAARRRGVAGRVVGTDLQPAVLRQALDRGILDEATDDPARAASGADLVVFSTPVDAVANQVLATAPACRPGTLLTDTGSTKEAIVRALEGRLPDGVLFVGSHPLAGSEKHGPEHADANLFHGRLALVTPAPDTPEPALAAVTRFWQALGSEVRVLDPREHDRILALTSHLPHLLASTLAGILPAALQEYAATGFRDTSRLASGSPRVWNAIFQANRPGLLEALALFQGRLDEFRRALEEGDAERVLQLLAESKRLRDSLNQGP